MSAPENATSDVPESAPVHSGSAADSPSATAPAPAAEPVPLPDPGPQAPVAAPARRLPRAVGVALATAGLLAVTATSATVTVLVGRPDEPGVVAASAPFTATASASASASPTATPTPTPTAAATPTAAPLPTAPPAPKPTSTLKGTLQGGTHGGDLRYFLLPVPDGGETYGPSDGILMSDAEVSADFRQDDIMDVLKSYGYKESATRTYRTADGKMEVEVRLMRFGSTAEATEFAKGHTMKRDPIEIDGDPKAHGYVLQPEQQAYTGSMAGISAQGDVEYTISVQVKGNPDKALLSELMKRQRERLSSAGG